VRERARMRRNPAMSSTIGMQAHYHRVQFGRPLYGYAFDIRRPDGRPANRRVMGAAPRRC
jgi:hypothetical protein